MDYNLLAELLYPQIDTLPEDMEKKYPPRNLPEGAKVTRFAPSPTGFVHFGSLFPTFVSERLAHQSGGVFYLRIEDTDSKREVADAAENLIRAYARYGIKFDEGATVGGETGDYGPYRQSERVAIYQTYAKDLVRRGLAYPCFCTAEELEAIRAEQTESKLTPGYYGKYAVWRDATLEAVKAKLDAGVPFVLRLRSNGDPSNPASRKFTDLVKGTVDYTENFIDHIILKSNGVPDYHFAHAVDDHLMGTTHVVRGEEWLPSLPLHIELFSDLGFRLPKYLHISQLMKSVDGAKKKLSKRDNEAALSYYQSAGYPALSVIEYVMTLLNSNFEEWRTANGGAAWSDFPFSVKKMSPSGCLFDTDKLGDVSKNVISRLSAQEVYDGALAWAEEFSPDFAALLRRDEAFSVALLGIGRGGAKPRKDFALWADVEPYMAPYFDETYKIDAPIPTGDGAFAPDTVRAVFDRFLASYDPADDAQTWFAKVKAVAESVGYTTDMKEYKKNPAAYPGSVADASMFLRVAVTGRTTSPDLCEVMRLLGIARVTHRIQSMASAIK